MTVGAHELIVTRVVWYTVKVEDSGEATFEAEAVDMAFPGETAELAPLGTPVLTGTATDEAPLWPMEAEIGTEVVAEEIPLELGTTAEPDARPD